MKSESNSERMVLMSSRRCPSCGHSYNGKRCRNCLYEPFGEITTSFELHSPEKALRREASADRQSPVRPTFPARSRKKNTAAKQILKRIGIFWIALSLISGIFQALPDIVADLGGAYEEVWAPQPEPLPLPESGLVLYEDADILVIADWDGITPMNGDIPIYVRNFTGDDLIVSTDGVAINGCMLQDVFFYCDAYRNSVSRADLWIDMALLEQTGIEKAQYLQLSIDVMDEDYNILVDNALAAVGNVYTQELDASGEVLYDRDGFRLVFQGLETFSSNDSILYFYAENQTDHFMALTANELLISGKETGCWLWQNFLPGTKGVFYCHLTDFVMEDGNAPAEVELFLTPDGDWEQEIYIGIVNFPLN